MLVRYVRIRDLLEILLVVGKVIAGIYGVYMAWMRSILNASGISEIYINTTMRIPRYNNRRMYKLLYNCQAIRHPYTPKSLFVDSSHVSPSPSPLR